MNWLLNLSFRFKLPLWSSVLIVTTAVAVSTALMVQAYDDLEKDLLDSSASLGRTLAKTLFPAMLHDDLWRAFEIIRAPLDGKHDDNPVQPEMILALDKQHRVFSSTDPKKFAFRADIRQYGEEYARLTERLDAKPHPELATVQFHGAHRIYVATPVGEEGALLGTLVVVHSMDRFLPRFVKAAMRGAIIGALVLAVLLPINWYWGQRTARPLVQLARSIDNVARGMQPQEPPPGTYAYRDELGQLFEAYGLMVKSLREKLLLENEVIRSERLAAVGRLSAGIAHEINNPLGGMLVALNNFKRRGGHDDRTLKTVSMIERGLSQIRDTVSAMLVEAKVTSREFAPEDVQDVRKLLAAEAYKRTVSIRIESGIAEPVALPATMVRQILINLLLNAVRASDPSGTVRCSIQHADNSLTIKTENSGQPIAPEVMRHLFEPFASGSDAGHGLGLWVTYQIVSQLGGQITASRDDGLTLFIVIVPTGEAS